MNPEKPIGLRFSFRSVTAYIIAPLGFILLVLFGHLKQGEPQVTYTLAVALLMAVWWITEIIPLSITSLLPVVLFPFFGIMDGRAVSSSYFNDVIFLFIGGFLVAIAMQRWQLHRRIALRILMITGISPGRILLGFMLSAAFLSMWISNTATAMMMLPIVISVIEELEESLGKKNISKYTIGLLLGLAYSCSVGGLATLVGTPPNQAFASIFHIMFPQGPGITFAEWFIFGFPLTIILLGVLWIYLHFRFRPKHLESTGLSPSTFRDQYRGLGAITFEEKIVLIDFIILALLWLFRSDLVFGGLVIPGWSRLFTHSAYLNDGTVAIMMSIPLFLIPSRQKTRERIMTWGASRELPWNIVLFSEADLRLPRDLKNPGFHHIWVSN